MPLGGGDETYLPFPQGSIESEVTLGPRWSFRCDDSRRRVVQGRGLQPWRGDMATCQAVRLRETHVQGAVKAKFQGAREANRMS